MGHSGVNSLTRCNLFCHPRAAVSVIHLADQYPRRTEDQARSKTIKDGCHACSAAE